MVSYKTILCNNSKKGVYEIILNRPEIHNAFNEIMIQELTDAITNVDNAARVLVLSAEGKSFCAGADLHWMRRMKEYDFATNRKDAEELATMLEKLYRLPIPTIAKIQGSAFGGGVGLAVTCDISVAAKSALFSLSEVKLGLVPACISPYLLRRVSPGALRPYFLTGERMDSYKAKEIGIIHEVVEECDLSTRVNKIVENILLCGPQAIVMAKELLENVPCMTSKHYIPYTADMIAKLRVSPEGQEGLSAFFEKRPPKW